MSRAPIAARSFLLRSDVQVNAALALIPQLPLDDERPIEVLIREEPKSAR